MKMQKYQEPVLKNSFSGDKVGAYCDHCLHHLLAPTLGHSGKSLTGPKILYWSFFVACTDQSTSGHSAKQHPGKEPILNLLNKATKNSLRTRNPLLQFPLEFRIIQNNISGIEFTFRWLSSCSPTASSTPTLPWTPSSTRFSQKTLKRVSERYSL